MAHRNRWFTWVYLLKMVNYSMAMLNYQRVNRLIDFEDQLRHVETGELNLQLFSWMESNFSQI